MQREKAKPIHLGKRTKLGQKCRGGNYIETPQRQLPCQDNHVFAICSPPTTSDTGSRHHNSKLPESTSVFSDFINLHKYNLSMLTEGLSQVIFVDFLKISSFLSHSPRLFFSIFGERKKESSSRDGLLFYCFLWESFVVVLNNDGSSCFLNLHCDYISFI